ncbi:MAG: tRNA (adenosine(37)-N6)-threonylcarbamoyltransferase complex dimerization subunit type 1 TsaB [Rhizobiaceae bacterium MnEN-MB40S]|nr:MAG: tRNA (adenosine(37)-N6)-threonylcarbamoyltransferase complex dimerization subunit type 1 TsaB [Rhizobiaceae bacterium MnEN-MB40S]
MKLLAVDTAAHLCAACLYDSQTRRVAGRAVEDIGRGHAERLIAVIEKALDQASLDYDSVDRLCVCVGPGSFTGIRVGVAAMRGMALSLDLPLVGVAALEALAAEVGDERAVLAVLDARRGEVYAQLFPSGGTPSEARAMSPEEAMALAVDNSAVLVGSGAEIMAGQSGFDMSGLTIAKTVATPDIETIARLGAQRAPDAAPPGPLYLRSPDAKPQQGFAVARRMTGHET